MGAHVLFVEDDENIRGLVERTFVRSGYVVRTATEGVDALRLLEDEAPDLIVLDLMPPWVNGIEVLTTLRQRPQLEKYSRARHDGDGNERVRPAGLWASACPPQTLRAGVGGASGREASPEPGMINSIQRPAVILLVEDNTDLRRMFRTALRFEGFEVQEAADGFEALRLIDEGAAKLIILDLRLPIIDGLTVLRELERKRKVPVVVVTASDEDVTSFDVECVLRKPVTPDKLIVTVKRCLAKSGTAEV